MIILNIFDSELKNDFVDTALISYLLKKHFSSTLKNLDGSVTSPVND